VNIERPKEDIFRKSKARGCCLLGIDSRVGKDGKYLVCILILRRDLKKW